MRLLDYAISYHRRAGGSPGYGEQLRVLCKRLPWEVEDLTADRIDSYLTDALSHLAPSTVANHRRMLNTLRRAAAKDGLLVDSSIATPLRRVKWSLPIVRAWSHDEIRKLLAVASEMPGNFRRCPRSILMPAWILVGYSSGLRLGDMLAIRYDAIRGNRLAFVMQKTGRPHVVILDPNALHAIASLPVVGPKIFGSHVSRWRIIPAIRETVQRAGLCGSGKFLRRSSATYAEIAGISATGHLGHLTAGLAQKHYVDPLLVAEMKRPVPPIALNIADHA
jgi:integrase